MREPDTHSVSTAGCARLVATMWLVNAWMVVNVYGLYHGLHDQGDGGQTAGISINPGVGMLIATLAVAIGVLASWSRCSARAFRRLSRERKNGATPASEPASVAVAPPAPGAQLLTGRTVVVERHPGGARCRRRSPRPRTAEVGFVGRSNLADTLWDSRNRDRAVALRKGFLVFATEVVVAFRRLGRRTVLLGAVAAVGGLALAGNRCRCGRSVRDGWGKRWWASHVRGRADRHSHVLGQQRIRRPRERADDLEREAGCRHRLERCGRGEHWLRPRLNGDARTAPSNVGATTKRVSSEPGRPETAQRRSPCAASRTRSLSAPVPTTLAR